MNKPESTVHGDTVGIGHNNPPDPISDATTPFQGALLEAENWLDGRPVENIEQMKAVDALLKDIGAAEKALAAARDHYTKPLHEAWKAEIANWKPTIDDIAAKKKGLKAIGEAFKKAEREKREAEERARREEMEAARRAAEVAAQEAEKNAGDMEAQRAADAAADAAREAQKAAIEAEKGRKEIKGLRTVTRYEIEDGRSAINWIATHDRDAMTAFLEDYVRRNHAKSNIAGVRVWKEKAA